MRHNLNPLVRPSISTNEIPPKIIKKRSILLPTLISVCAYFIILIAICIGALVLVGKNMSFFDSSTSDKQYRTSKNLDDIDNHFMTKSAVNKIKFYNKNRDNSEVTSFTLLSTKSIDLNTNKNMSFSKVIEQLNFRLPATIRPTLYNLYLHPDLKTKTFCGNVKIHLEITKPTNFIPVHIKLLNITKTDLFKKNPGGNSSVVEIKQSFEYGKFEYWVTETVNNLEVGDYILDFNFTGSLANRIVGFYQSSYFDKKKNESRVIATSKFEPTYARQAFPCFDEPALKAPYEVRLVRPTGDGYISLSNMPVLSEAVIEGTTNTLTTFVKSVAMSTYLTVFVVCDFASKTTTITPTNPEDNFEMSVYATNEQLEKTTYALETGKKVIEYYIDYFGIKYPLPKLDMAAIPDFVSGAMETWGLVTYRETSLLYDAAVSSTVNKQRIVTVIAHELAHMWFGNLVTMNWWNDLWLNEGFASYIEYKGTHAAEPDWNIMDQFIIDDLHPVLTIDATVASHPIVLTVSNPDQITAIFDTITYSKGSSLIRMLEDFVGDDVFKTGVTAYLEKHKESTAVTDDLLEELEALNIDESIDIRQVMSTWTNQKGFPVINVVKTDTGYTLTQKRFISNPEKEDSETDASEFNYRWTVPITYITDVQKTVQRSWFHHDDTQHDLKLDTIPTWIKINNQQIGYYRVNYDNENWKALTSALIADVNSLAVSDRSHLLNDAFNLADATHLSYDIAMDLTKYLDKETQHVPWATMSSKLITIKNLLYRRDSSEKYLKYATELVKSAYEIVNWEVNAAEHSKNHLRITVLGLACSLGLPECVKEAQDKFTEWLALDDFVTNRPHPDLRSIIYSYGMANAGSDESWEKMFAMFVAEQDATEKLKLMSALTSVKNIDNLDKLIKLAATETQIIKGQDYFTVLQNIAANRYGEDLVWNYVRENWDKLVERFTLNERTLGRMIPSITARFTTKTRLTEMEKFFEDNPEAGAGEAARGEALENVSYNIKWLENNEKAIEKWLDSNNV